MQLSSLLIACGRADAADAANVVAVTLNADLAVRQLMGRGGGWTASDVLRVGRALQDHMRGTGAVEQPPLSVRASGREDRRESSTRIRAVAVEGEGIIDPGLAASLEKLEASIVRDASAALAVAKLQAAARVGLAAVGEALGATIGDHGKGAVDAFEG